MKKVIITGATSFIGRHLINELTKHDYKIYAIVRQMSQKALKLSELKNVYLINLEMAKYSEIDQYIDTDCDYLIHFAWEGTRGLDRDNESLQYNNYYYSMELVNAAINLGCKTIISAGSQAEYGICNEVISEYHSCKPTTEYGRYKLKFYEDTYEICEKNNVSFKEPRFFSLYGLDDYEGTMIISTIKKMLNNEICNFTEAKQMWNFLHIDDAIKGIIALIEKECQDGVYNFGSDDTRKLREYIEEIKSLCNSSSELNFGSIPYPSTGIVSIQPDNTKLKEETGWVPQISFNEGINKIISYIRESNNEKN